MQPTTLRKTLILCFLSLAAAHCANADFRCGGFEPGTVWSEMFDAAQTEIVIARSAKPTCSCASWSSSSCYGACSGSTTVTIASSRQ